MTGLLKDLMEERAHHAGAPTLDLDAIIQTGDRRVRRRRVVAGGAVGAAAVAAAVVAVVVISPATFNLRGDKAEPVQKPPVSQFAEELPTYAAGTSIHYGADVIDIAPYSASTFVQTDDGFVFVDGGTVFLADGDTVEQIGVTDMSSADVLVADDTGPYVAWVDTSATPAPELVIYDTAARDEAARTSEGSLPLKRGTVPDEFTVSMVQAIDGGVVYWHNSNGVQAYDIESGESATVKAGASSGWLFDVQSGVLARSSYDDLAVTVSADPKAEEPNFAGRFASLSPDGSMVATSDGQEQHIFSVSAPTQDLLPPTPDHPYVTFGQWLDNDRFTLLGDRTPDQTTASFDVLTCSVGDQACTVAEADILHHGDVLIRPNMPNG
jgi:hypothetical protein